MILAYLWVSDWIHVERVCHALRGHVLRHVRRVPDPWHAVRCLLPPRTPDNAHSAWVRELHATQDLYESVRECTKTSLGNRQRIVWNGLHAATLVVYQWNHGEAVLNDSVDPYSRFEVKVDMLRTTTAELRDQIVKAGGHSLAPYGRVTWIRDPYGEVGGWDFSFETHPGMLWSSHPEVKSFAHLHVAIQSKHTPVSTVYCTVSGSLQRYAVKVSQDDMFATLARYLAAVRGMPMSYTAYFVVRGRPMNINWSLHGCGVMPNETIHVHES